MEISSAPGQGTTVRLLFPAIEPGNDNQPHPAKAEPTTEATGGSETILVVDDEEGVLDLAVHHLTALGYRVLPARSGEEALEVLGREDAARIDLLFTDVVMPGGINGLVLAERARALRFRLRVLLASGYSEDLLAGGAPNGGIEVVSKPYRQADLASRVRAVLDGPGEGTA
jgi:CheY-like chemotaxis protein